MSVLTAEAMPVSPMETKDCERSDMEDTVAHTIKASDSGYSNSCSNSQSQRSGSSKSRHSGSSSGSSGYCGHPSTAGSSLESSFQRPSTTKRKEYKKKKLKGHSGDLINDSGVVTTSGSTNNLETIALIPPASNSLGLESTILTTGVIQTNELESHQISSSSHNPLTYESMKKLKGNDNTVGDICEETESLPNCKEPKNKSLRLLEELKIVHPKEEFLLVVSMQEGTVLFTSPNLTNVLGYPKDLWLGRSLTHFIHPKDRDALNKYITSCVADPLINRRNQNFSNVTSVGKQSLKTFPCCIRQYRGLMSSGFGVTENKIDYLPCKISFFFHELTHNRHPSSSNANNEKNQGSGSSDGICDTLLIANVRLISSSYSDGDEVCCSPTFVTQHSTSMCLTHVDQEVIPYFGYMPHDMIGRSVFDFYHPEDLPYLKEVYKNVLKDKTQPYNGGKPYRFRTQNGTYALVQTDWCAFVNPWTKKLEFVIGQHHIVQGPPVPDVTTMVEQNFSLSEDVAKETLEIKEEIMRLLNETGQHSYEMKQQISKYGKEIITFMEKFFDEEKTAQSKSLPYSFFLSFSQDRDSEMLGEISPHHEYCDSKSSSETPPSYKQLNYNDNIERFFESKPKTTRSDESNGQSSTERNTRPSSNESNEEGKLSPTEEMNCNSSSSLNTRSGESSSLSFGSSGNAHTSGNSNASTSDSYRTPHLTEELLSRHNLNMEKKMVQKHRERNKSDREQKMKDGRRKKCGKIMGQQGSHGVKRSGSHSWEGEPYKSIKQTHEMPANGPYYPGGSIPQHVNLPSAKSVFPKTPVSVTTNVNLWPPFSVTVTPMHSSSAYHSHLNYSAAHLPNPMMPVYYIQPEMSSSAHNPAQHSKGPMPPYIQPRPPYASNQVQYVGSMMYHPIPMPMFGAPPLIFSPLTMLPAPLMPTPPMRPPTKRNEPSHEQQRTSPPAKTNQMSSSQGTFVKAEPGLAKSNSLQQALSDLAKREAKAHFSPTHMQEKTLPGQHNNSDNGENTMQNDTSSYYSSFYSYMKTDDKSDESMRSLTENESSSDANNDSKNENVWKNSFGKSRCKASEEHMKGHVRKIITDSPWSKGVELTPDLIFKYQVNDHVLSEVLESDLKLLAGMYQPLMVNEQLCQLYLDLDSFNQNDRSLETSIGFTTSSGSSAEGEERITKIKLKKKKRTTNYDKIGMLFEENAPMPPPLQNGQLAQMPSPCSTAA